MTNGLSHPCHLDESTFILEAREYFFSFFDAIHVSKHGIAPDETPRIAVSHLGLFCLPMSHKKDAMQAYMS